MIKLSCNQTISTSNITEMHFFVDFLSFFVFEEVRLKVVYKTLVVFKKRMGLFRSVFYR